MTTANALSSRTEIHNSKSDKSVEIGRVLSVGSSQVQISVNKAIIRNNDLHLAELGTVLKIITSDSIVVAMVSSLKIGAADNEGVKDGCIAQLDIMGEISTNKTTRETKFFRGVRSFPVLNQAVLNMSSAELGLIFSTKGEASIQVGKLQQDSSITAEVKIDDLLSKHFAIIGSTGSGKSCSVALILQAILKDNPYGHVVLFDPHNEYSKSFGEKAHVIRNESLDLPLWMFNFEETVELLTSDIRDHAIEEEDILSEVILDAKRMFERTRGQVDLSTETKFDEKDLQRAASHISLDSPVPYRIRDLIRLIENQMGKLENNSNLPPYKRLKRRIESLVLDPRYQFVFRNQASPVSIESLCGNLFRIPVNGRPISILDLSGIPSEALNIVVAVISRLAFELAMWADRKIPILLVCEEAHRYIPADKSLGFKSTRKAISRIAKEGRKYGVSLAIVSQRPSELEPSTLSQCSTIFSMRLSNELDQNFVRAAVPEGAAELLSFLPSLGTAEAMIFGESVNLPMRVVLNNLPAEYRPHSSSAKFSEKWNAGEQTPLFMEQVYNNWRTRSHNKTSVAEEAPVESYQIESTAAVHADAHIPKHIALDANGIPRRNQLPHSGGQAAPLRRPQETVRAYVPPAQNPHAAPRPVSPTSAAAIQALRAQHEGGNSPQTLKDVKNFLNSAFHKGG